MNLEIETSEYIEADRIILQQVIDQPAHMTAIIKDDIQAVLMMMVCEAESNIGRACMIPYAHYTCRALNINK